MSQLLLKSYIEQLEKHAKVKSNDVRHKSYVEYINAFLSCLGKERVYLVGSTAEKLKLRSSTNGGDADFLICSGRLEIPIDTIEERPDLPCYVKVGAQNLRPDICGNLIGGYLSAELLRDVRPELFTILRAMYTVVTSIDDTIPGHESRVTTTGVPMKVGLGRTDYRNIEIEDNILPYKIPNKRPKLDREAEVTANLKKRWRGVHLNPPDMKILQRILNLVIKLKVPGSRGEHHGQINRFAHDLDTVMNRKPLAEENEPDNASGESLTNPNQTYFDGQQASTNPSDRKVRATYSEMTTKDFVPALRIVGDRKLEALVKWRQRVEHASWPPRNIVKEIFDTDIFLVARDAPVKPDHQTDFCLSFNLAELKLGQCLSTTQRRVYLVLKSYLSGILKRLHSDLGRNSKFKSYYLKTAFFWVCECEPSTLWKEQNIIKAVEQVLHFLSKRLHERKLSHYFVNSNLFAELEELDCDILQNCIQEILRDPVESIGEFDFKRVKRSSGEFESVKENDSRREEVWLTEDEVRCIKELEDGSGNRKYMDKLEDGLIDMLRGFNESTRDADGNAPIKEAIIKAFDVFLEEERQKEMNERTSDMSVSSAATGTSSQSIPGNDRSQASAIAGLIGNFVTEGGSRSMNSPKANKRVDLLVGFGSLFPGVSERLAEIGGRDGVRNVLQQTTDQSVDHLVELKSSFGKYLSCADEKEEVLVLELKQKVFAYFIGRKEKEKKKNTQI